MIDSLDPAEIELWFADDAYRIHRLGNAVTALASEASDAAEKSTRQIARIVSTRILF